MLECIFRANKSGRRDVVIVVTIEGVDPNDETVPDRAQAALEAWFDDWHKESDGTPVIVNPSEDFLLEEVFLFEDKALKHLKELVDTLDGIGVPQWHSAKGLLKTLDRTRAYLKEV